MTVSRKCDYRFGSALPTSSRFSPFGSFTNTLRIVSLHSTSSPSRERTRPPCRLDLGEQLADVADAKRHAARVGVGDAQVERLPRHALDLDHLDPRLAAGDQTAGDPVRRAFRQAHEIEHRGVVRECLVRFELEAEHAVPVLQRLVHVADGEAHDRADDRPFRRVGGRRPLNRLDEVAVRIAHDDRLRGADRRRHRDRRCRPS